MLGKLCNGIVHDDAALARRCEWVALDAIEDQRKIWEGMCAFEIVICLVARSVDAVKDLGEGRHDVWDNL